MISAVTSSYQSMVIGAGNAMLNLIISILDGVVCKVGLSLLFVNVIWRVTAQSNWFMTATGYFWGTSLSRALPAVICMIYFYSGAWKKKNLLGT